MKVYIAMWADRHSDVEPSPFTDLQVAISAMTQGHAKLVEQFGVDRVGALEVNAHPPAGWSWSARYGFENRIWIVEKELE